MLLNLKCLSAGWCLAAIAASLSPAAASDLRVIQAVRNNDTQLVRRLLKQHADVKATQGDGATALHWAAHLDNVAAADLLIRAGARVNAANDDGATPLYLACMNHSAPMVERLLAGGADANAKLLSGETALMTCARTGDATAVKALLVHGASVNAKESAHHQTALMWAAAEAHPEAVQMLLEFGADLRARSDAYPQTVVGEQTQRAGREKLNYTVLRGGFTPLLFTARSGDVESARQLLEKGANANDSLPDGMTALVLAAHSGNGKVGAVLLEKGADPNAAEIGYTALHAAVLRSDLELVKALLAHGANPNVPMTKGTPVRRDNTDFNLLAPLVGATPYLLAAKFLEPEIMRALKAGGADAEIAMPNGITPLMLAAGIGSGPNQSRRGIAVIDFGKVEPESQVLGTVQTAVSLGADVNVANGDGDTALHGAAVLGYDTVVQFLADHGAQLNAKNKRGLTPLAALLARGARRVPADAENGADLTGAPARAVPHASTVALLRRLGATQ
ncbi:MAG TPA: ankyrin repeat domain-containing protein [Bryobacteraceae bacterium]|nr:ankyrin repeat domain-containing protein [Bryobacteraceae bacterium]